jgi:aryl-alcohol dehydrogenase-like predicted oxidoreductase
LVADRLALGTVQFGLQYGIANRVGKVPFNEVRSILRKAGSMGIDTLDTAIAYGDSEGVLGRAGVQGWSIVTKLPALPEGCDNVGGWVEAQVQGSLNRLDVGVLDGVLLHRPLQLLGNFGQPLLSALELLKKRGIVRKIGISIYGPDELEKLEGVMQFDLVQSPLNIMDRRLIESGWARRLKEQGVELHARSIFLQGLLLMAPEKVPGQFARWAAVLDGWTSWLNETDLSPLQACLGYAMSVPEIDKVVVGVDNVEQLAEILAISDRTLPEPPRWATPVDPDLLNPAHWGQR